MVGETEDIVIEESTGNVFADLGLPNPEELLAKAKLASAIEDAIEQRGLAFSRAAEIMGLDQANVSKITRGQLDEFSTERLLHFLICLGLDVEVVIHKESKPADREGLISVAYV